MAMRLCEICGVRVADGPIESANGAPVCVCSVCYEIKHLLDGLHIDLRINIVEYLILQEPSSTSFSRGFNCIN